MTAPDTTYDSYARDPGYIAANAALIDGLDLSGVTRVADLACGTGLLSQLLLARAPRLVIAGIDLDPVQIGLARAGHIAAGIRLVDSLGALRAAAADGTAEGGAVLLQTASAMDLPFAQGELDLVVIGNAIHMMPDRGAFLAEIARVLRPGGRFAFNSVFYAGTFAPGSESVFTECMKEAVLVLNEMNAARRAAGERPIPRQRGTVARAFRQTDWLTPADWAAETTAAGFSIIRKGERTMMISQSGLEAVGAYGGLAEVLMSGYPVDVASMCMQQGIARAFGALGITEVPRNWLEIVAERR